MMMVFADLRLCASIRDLNAAWAGALAFLALVLPAHAESVSPRRLLEVVDFGPPVISPDGRRVAFRVEQASIERNTYDTVWYVQSLDGDSMPLRVADGGTPLRDYAGGSVPPGAVWSPDGQWIYYRALMGERIDVWRAAMDGSGAEPVTLDAADVREFSLEADGRTLVYSVGATREAVAAAEQAEYDDGVRIDASVPIGQGLVRSGKTEGRLATQRFRGVWYERAPLLADVQDRWKSIHVDTRVVEALASADVPPRPLSMTDLPATLPVAWKLAHEEGGRIALLTRVGNGQGLLQKPGVELSVLSGVTSRRARHCTHELCVGKAIDRIQWRPGSDDVLFTVTDPKEALAQSIFRWNVETGEVVHVVSAQGLISGGRDPSSHCGISARALVCVAADAGRPPHLERIDIDTGNRSSLFDPNEGLANALARGPAVRTLRWTDALGRQFTGKFFAASSEGNRPAPLFVTHYSCTGFVRGGVGDEWPLVSLAQHGIAALCINQLSDYVLDPVERVGQGMSAVQSVVALLASEGVVDRELVGMGGLSFGSSATLWTATESTMLTAASISSNDISPYNYLINSLRGDTFLGVLRDLWGLGAPDETPTLWQVVSPALKIDSISVPILFQQAEQEYLTGLDLTIPLLRDNRADLYVFPNEPHIKFQPRHLLAVNERNLDWFRFWLLGIEDPASRRQAEYSHWRAMREVFRTEPPRGQIHDRSD